MNHHSVAAITFPILIVMVILWLVLFVMLLARLRRHHPQQFDVMGRPSLLRYGDVAGTWATVRFIVTRKHVTLHDAYLSRLSDFMLAFFAAYCVLFIVLVIAASM